LEDWWNRKVEELSKGMAQKVQFITTVLHRPQLLILDEPFSGFDPINTNLVKSEILKLRDEGTTIILSTHNMNSVEEICDHIALLNSSKKIISGTVQEVRERNTEQTYEIEFKGNMMSFTHNLWVGFELVSQQELAKDHNIVAVKPLQNNDINALLGAVLPAVKIVGVRKVIPSMTDVFIKAVEEQREADAILAEEVRGGDHG
jgi:ABC-2 type transport system ATP-binding protein